MKNSFLTLAFVALATICNSNLFAKVLPVNEEFESLEIFILENFEMNEPVKIIILPKVEPTAQADPEKVNVKDKVKGIRTVNPCVEYLE